MLNRLTPCRCRAAYVICIRSHRLVCRHPGPQQRSAKHRAETIKISEAVDLCELATRKRLTTPALNLRISSKVRDGTLDVPWRFGDDEMRLLRDGVTPICFADTIVIQHLLGTQPAGSQGNCGALMGLKLLRLRPAMRMTEVLARS